MNEHYLYIHRRADNNLVFYIGIGKKDRSKRGDKYRNKNWKAVCKEAGGFVVEYLSTGLSRKQVLELENEYLDNPPKDWKLTNIKKSSRRSSAFTTSAMASLTRKRVKGAVLNDCTTRYRCR